MLQSDNAKLLILQSDKSKNSWLWVLFGGRRAARQGTRSRTIFLQCIPYLHLYQTTTSSLLQRWCDDVMMHDVGFRFKFQSFYFSAVDCGL